MRIITCNIKRTFSLENSSINVVLSACPNVDGTVLGSLLECPTNLGYSGDRVCYTCSRCDWVLREWIASCLIVFFLSLFSFSEQIFYLFSTKDWHWNILPTFL